MGTALSERPLLELTEVCVSYGDVAALREVSFSLESRKIHSVVGEHGAGKSSLCHLVGGFVRPSSGQVAWCGVPLRSLSPGSARRLGIELVTQSNDIFDDLSVADNLFLNPAHRHALSHIKARNPGAGRALPSGVRIRP